MGPAVSGSILVGVRRGIDENKSMMGAGMTNMGKVWNEKTQDSPERDFELGIEVEIDMKTSLLMI
jgi:hypothetical protein